MRDCFRDVIRIDFAQAPILLGRTLIPDFQLSTMGDKDGPHILARQSFAHRPGFVENRNSAVT